MGFVELFLIGVGLSMDAFAVSIYLQGTEHAEAELAAGRRGSAVFRRVSGPDAPHWLGPRQAV